MTITEKYIETRPIHAFSRKIEVDIYKNPSPSEFAQILKDNPDSLRGFVDKSGMGDVYIFDVDGKFLIHQQYDKLIETHANGIPVMIVFAMEKKEFIVSDDASGYLQVHAVSPSDPEEVDQDDPTYLTKELVQFFFKNLQKNIKLKATRFPYFSNTRTYRFNLGKI